MVRARMGNCECLCTCTSSLGAGTRACVRALLGFCRGPIQIWGPVFPQVLACPRARQQEPLFGWPSHSGANTYGAGTATDRLPLLKSGDLLYRAIVGSGAGTGCSEA